MVRFRPRPLPDKWPKQCHLAQKQGNLFEYYGESNYPPACSLTTSCQRGIRTATSGQLCPVASAALFSGRLSIGLPLAAQSSRGSAFFVSTANVTMTTLFALEAKRGRSWLAGIQSQHQRHRMQRRRLKTIVFVELLGAVVKRMHQQRSDTSVMRNHHRPVDGVLQKGCAKLDTLRSMINRQPSQHHHRNWIRHIPANRAGCHLVRDSACSHGVVAVNTAVLIRHYKRAAGTAHLVGHCTALEPLVENGLAALKFIQNVGGRERLR